MGAWVCGAEEEREGYQWDYTVSVQEPVRERERLYLSFSIRINYGGEEQDSRV
jgi:hypothetical protein